MRRGGNRRREGRQEEEREEGRRVRNEEKRRKGRGCGEAGRGEERVKEKKAEDLPCWSADVLLDVC